jgi:photosystem II stability/assembly factor-like uncharacterized protein
VAVLIAATLIAATPIAAAAGAAAAPAGAAGAGVPRAEKVGLSAVSFASLKYGWAVGPQATILRTKDGGRHWARQYAQDRFRVDDTFFTSVQAISSTTCWVIGGGFIYKTTDGGATWKRMARRQRPTELTMNSWTCGAFVGKVGWVASRNGDIIGTTNGGATWTRQRNALGIDDVADIWALDATHAYIVMNATGGHYVLATTDGSHWAEASSRQIWEYWHPDYTGICANSARNIWLSTSTGEVCVSRDGGQTWKVSNPGVGPYAEGSADWLGIADIACYGNTVCAVGIRQNMGSAILTGNDGWTWGWVGFAPAGGTSPRPIGDSDWISEKTGWTVGGAGQVYRTQDGGITWQKLR